MKFKTTAQDLGNATAIVQDAIERESQRAIFTHVLMSLDGNDLSMRGTGMATDIGTVIEVEASGSGDEVELATTSGHKLGQVLKLMDGEIAVEADNNEGMMRIVNGRNRCKLRMLDAQTYPSIAREDTIVSWNMDVSELDRELERTRRMMGSHDVRVYLNGILLRYRNGEIDFVATDGHRLSWSQHHTSEYEKGEATGILAAKEVAKIIKLVRAVDGELEMSLSDRTFTIAHGRTELTSSLVEGTYPNFERVVPKESDEAAMIEFDREELQTTLRRLSIMGSERMKKCTMVFEKEDHVRFNVETMDREEANEDVSATVRAGSCTEIGFNIRYLLDFVDSVTFAKVRMQIEDGHHAVLMRPGGDEEHIRYNAVLMPMGN